MARTLKPEDRIARYRVVGPLGAGGMGEVYRARDQSLERDVALKILPPDLVRSEERVRRFVLEAKSASSLNHPHIVTIYEIGADRVSSADGIIAPQSETLHFISMELVSGDTLTSKIHEERTELKTLLEWLAQAAEGLAKAHAAGIIHRDLKPGNIMISRDGYAKVLDFGLAKLTEQRPSEGDLTAVPTVAERPTAEGAVIGTVGYMSPEQVQAKAVDARSDIFSFGCILYEAATRRQPFAADSSLEIMHRILHDTPARIEELNPRAPAELRRLIRRCLAKNPDQRLQSMKDLALELREIVEEYDALSASASSGSGTLARIGGRRRLPAPILIGSGLLVAGLVVVAALWVWRSGRGVHAVSNSMQFSALTLNGDAWSAGLSPDGRFLAYVTGPPEKRTIRMRQLASGSDVEILPPQSTAPWGLRFSPDASYLFYVRADADRPGYGALFQIPTLGGSPRRRASDVDSPPTLSPDGKRVAFRRHVSPTRQDRLVLVDLENDQERILATVNPPRGLFGGPAWSPDGSRLAAVEMLSDPRHGRVVTFRVADGKRDSMAGNPWATISYLAWLPDQRGLVLAATEMGSTTPDQVWLQSFSSGSRSRITNDGYDYQWLALPADGSMIAAQRHGAVANVWAVDLAPPHHLRQLTSNTGVENTLQAFNVALNGSLYFVARRNDHDQVLTIGAEGGGEKQVTSGPYTHVSARSFPDGSVLFGRIGADGRQHLWRADADGGNTRQLTNGTGENARALSRDGKMIVFDRVDRPGELWIMPAEGGSPRLLSPSNSGPPLISQDSRLIVFTRFQPEQKHFETVILPVSGGAPVATLRLPPRATNLQWAPDSKSISYQDEADSSRNIHLQPIGGRARMVTAFHDGRILDHRWARDGTHLLVTRKIQNAVNIWALSIDGRNPVQLTDFPTGEIFGLNTPADGRTVMFAYGAEHADVVLIRDFR